MSSIPSHSTVLVVGGGPSGSYAASALAREGIQVTLLEAAKFPRYHIGESMLPSVNTFFGFIGAEEKLRAHGFAVKRGAAVKFNQHKKEGYTDFTANNPRNASWNVIRSEFDELLLRHASESGANVFEETKVLELQFAPDQPKDDPRPISASYKRDNGQTGTISFDYLVDASGRNGIMSTKYLKNRRMNDTLHNLACWAYWTGQKQYMPGTNRENAPWFEALTDESGWAWFIPLHNGTVSVGIVMDSAISARKKAAGRAKGEESLKDHYLSQMELAPGLQTLLEGATLKEDNEKYFVRSASDFSYAADRYSGNHFRLVGDASAFIDPFFSSGVHLALLGGLTAATTICASIKNHCTEADATQFHNVKVATAYTRFLLVVMSSYKQIRSQTTNVLVDGDDDSFDRAFDIFRPVIQGTADVGQSSGEDELQRTMEFCKDIFAPTDPEMQQAVGLRIDPALLSINEPILSESQIDQAIAADDVEARMVVNRVNARKAIQSMCGGADVLQTDDVNGYVANLRTGSLGLVKLNA